MTFHRWIVHARVPDYLRLGWMALPSLEGTGHGIYSAHCIWLCDCPMPDPREPFKECEYPECKCPRYGRCGNAEASTLSSHQSATQGE